MKPERVLQLWEEKKPSRDRVQLTVAIREDLLKKINEHCIEYRLSRAQAINDILAIGIYQLERQLKGDAE